MGPVLGRVAFTVGIFLVILALLPLPFLEWGSAEFVVDVLALAMSSAFLGYVVWRVRQEVRMGLGERDREGQPEGRQQEKGR